MDSAALLKADSPVADSPVADSAVAGEATRRPTDPEFDRMVQGRGPLSSADEVWLAAVIEAGVIARHVLERDPGGSRWPVGATEADLHELARRGRLAFTAFVECNLALVGLVVRQETQGWGSDADLFQEGCLGLIEAVRRFDHRRGCRFATYALYGIRAQVRTARIRRVGPIMLSADRVERLRRAQAVRSRLSQELGREATVEELAAALGRPVGWVLDLLAHRAEASLEASPGSYQVVDPGAGRALEAVLDAAMPGAELLADLPGQERAVIGLRFGFDPSGRTYSAAATARRLGVSVRQVRRVEANALELLRARCPQQARIHLSG